MGKGSPYRDGADVVVVTNEDCTGRKIGTMKASVKDQRDVSKAFSYIIDKYSLDLAITEKKNAKQIDLLKDDIDFKF